MRLRPLLAILLLALALLPAAPAGAGGGCHGPFQDGPGPVVETKMNCFMSTVTRVEVGDTVEWRNMDGTQHNVHSSAGFFGELPPKQAFAHTFNEPGVYPYVCTLHPGMVGAVVVGDGVPAAKAGAPAKGSDVAADDTVETDLTSAATAAGTGDWSAWSIVAGALALLLGLSLASGRMRRQRPDGSAAS